LRKIIIAIALVSLLSIAFVTPALADKGGQPNPNDNALWGQAHTETHQTFNDKNSEYYDPNFLGDVFSGRLFYGEPGWKGIDPPPYPGGIQEYWGYPK